MDSKPNSRTGDRKRTGVEAIDEEQDGIEVSGYVAHDKGEGAVTVRPGEPVDATVQFHSDDLEGKETALAVGAKWSADSEPRVAFKHIHPQLTLSDYLTPDRARELAAELRLAATYAEQGTLEAKADE